MLGCLEVFLKSTVERRFYDLGRIGYRGQRAVDFKFDPSKVLGAEELVQLRKNEPQSVGQSDELFDPRGFARQRTQVRKHSREPS